MIKGQYLGKFINIHLRRRTYELAPMIAMLSILYGLSRPLQWVFQSLDPIIAPITNCMRIIKTNDHTFARTCPSCPPVANFLSIASHSTQSTQPL